MKGVKRTNAYGLSENDVPKKVFIDTSVWIYTNGPQADPEDPVSACYSNLLSSLIMAKSTIFITPQVLSEFFNVTVRYFKNDNFRSLGQKAYRNSQDYKNNLPSMLSYVTSVLSTPNLVIITDIPVEDYTDFSSDNLDFNDNLYAKVCERDNLTMISHDGDFETCSFDVVIAKIDGR